MSIGTHRDTLSYVIALCIVGEDLNLFLLLLGSIAMPRHLTGGTGGSLYNAHTDLVFAYCGHNALMVDSIQVC